MEFAVINSGMEADDNIWFGPGRLHHSILQGSLAESIFILGMENNCDIVRGAAYAPELSNESDDRASQSTPGLIEFDSTKVVGSTSWLMQSLVSANRISQNLSIKNSKQLEDAKIYASAVLTTTEMLWSRSSTTARRLSTLPLRPVSRWEAPTARRLLVRVLWTRTRSRSSQSRLPLASQGSRLLGHSASQEVVVHRRHC